MTEPRVGQRLFIEKGPWAGHVGVVREVGVRDLFIRLDLENGIDTLTVPAMCRFPTPEDEFVASADVEGAE